MRILKDSFDDLHTELEFIKRYIKAEIYKLNTKRKIVFITGILCVITIFALLCDFYYFLLSKLAYLLL